MRADIMSDTTIIADSHWVPIGRGYEKYEEASDVYIRRGADRSFVAGGNHEPLGALFIHSAAEAERLTTARREALDAVKKDQAQL